MEVTGGCESLHLDEPADVGAVRRRLAALAHEAGLDEVRAGDAAIIATELGTNVLKHGRRGGALIGVVREGARRGVRIAAWDRGPGMNVAASLEDGVSTAGTRGAGLGAVARLASSFDAHAPAGKGSVVVADVFGREPAPRARFAIGGACVPFPGEQVCGDAWAAVVDGDVATVIAIDGLGHGHGAADAAKAVTGCFLARPHDELPAILERAHGIARSTRGAAATMVRVDLAARTVTVAGVGNVTPWLVVPAGVTGPTQQRQLVTQHGTLGQALPRVRAEVSPLPAGALVVVCSDGIKTRWNLDDHPGLAARAPATFATALWRDAARERDDTTVVVVAEAR